MLYMYIQNLFCTLIISLECGVIVVEKILCDCCTEFIHYQYTWEWALFHVLNVSLLIKILFSFKLYLQAEQAQTDACEKFEAMSARGKQELTSFRTRRVAAFKKSLIELAELEVKHAKSQYEYLRQSVLALRELA